MAATYTQSLSEALDLKVVGAYREGDGRQFIDFEELNANLFQVPAEYSDDQTSGEVQLTYTGDKLKGVAGVYYFDGTARGAFDASLGAINLTSLTKGSVDTESIAVYFDATWSLTDRLNLNAGVRWNRGRQGSDGVRRAVPRPAGRRMQTLFDQNNVPAGLHPAGRAEQLHERSQLLRCARRASASTSSVTDDVLAYVSYSQGLQERRLRHARQRDGESRPRATATIPRPPTTTRSA